MESVLPQEERLLEPDAVAPIEDGSIVTTGFFLGLEPTQAVIFHDEISMISCPYRSSYCVHLLLLLLSPVWTTYACSNPLLLFRST